MVIHIRKQHTSTAAPSRGRGTNQCFERASCHDSHQPRTTKFEMGRVLFSNVRTSSKQGTGSCICALSEFHPTSRTNIQAWPACIRPPSLSEESEGDSAISSAPKRARARRRRPSSGCVCKWTMATPLPLTAGLSTPLLMRL